MSVLRAAGLGPIIGHTTFDSCRLWIQARDPDGGPGGPGANRRTVGVIGVVTFDGAHQPAVRRGWYFRLRREYDRTGTFVLGKDVALGRHADDGVPPSKQDKPWKLAPDTEYVVRMATLTVDDALEDADTLTDVELARILPPIENVLPMLLEVEPEACEVRVRTFPRTAQKGSEPRLAFLLGSCRYPGMLWKVKEADRIFAAVRDHLVPKDDRAAARFTLMVGDQIYADELNRTIPIGRADTYEEFQSRYREAFDSPNMRAVLRTAPTYMILDDHEIEDNWSYDRVARDGKHELFNLAIGAYLSYQWSHGPRSFGRYFYYGFECAGYPFFALDTRTQRVRGEDGTLRDNHLLGRRQIDRAHKGQLRHFLDWLSEQQKKRGNVPKFVLTSSVFAPNPMSERIDAAGTPDQMKFAVNLKRRERSDSWPAYPGTRSEILEHVIAEGIQNVVFLSGDIHCSNIAELSFPAPVENLVAYDVTSSAFYWPWGFADGDPNDYVHDSRNAQQLDPFPVTGGNLHYRSWAFTQEDNFCRIDVDRAARSLEVRYFDRDGEPIRVTNRAGRTALINTLALAPW